MLSKKEIKQKEKELGMKPGRCGSGWSEWVVPDKPFWMWFVNLRWPCREHDIDYKIGGTEADRLCVDRKFWFNMEKVFMKSFFWRFKSFRKRAYATMDLYYEAVRYYGADKFNYEEGE